MTLRRILGALVLCLASFSVRAPAATQEAVVRIVAQGTTNEYLGSGFFSSANGRVLTCYHVIVGASKLTVITGGERYSDVIVNKIWPDYDLAELTVRGLPRAVPFIAPYSATPAELWKKPLEVYGNPDVIGDKYSRGFEPVTSRSDEFVRSGSIRSRDRVPKPLFAKDIDVITINMTIYNGDSGGPLVYNNRAVGVVSGSIEEGGSLAWAIPFKYINPGTMTVVDKPASQVSGWPPLALMSGEWANLRKAARLGEPLVAALDRYGDSVHGLRTNFDDAMSQRLPVFLADISRTQRLIDQEIARRGSTYSFEQDQEIGKFSEQLARKYETKWSNSELDTNGKRFEDASEDIARELTRYFKALPRTQKNAALEKEILDRWRVNQAAQLTMANNAESRLDRWEEQMGSVLDGVVTLGDAKRAFAPLNKSVDTMVKSETVEVRRMLALANESQRILERVWDADQ